MVDSAVPERRLAQANLLRVRGQLAEAKQALLDLLAERPNDPDALDLLARTCEDAGETEEARRWRGLAGGSSAVVELPPAPPETRLPAWALPAVIGLGLAVIGLAFAMGRSSAQRTVAPVVGGRVEAPGSTAGPVPSPTPLPQETAGGTITPREPAPVPNGEPRAETQAEASGLARLTAAEGGAGRALGVEHDPRTETVTVTFAPRTGESPRREAAALARTAFGVFGTAKTLQMRAVRGRELVYLATASRDRLATVEAEGWTRENEANPDALADALLSEEWSVPESSEEKSSDGKLGGTP